jgi:nucleoside-diphosphate-sugar epimerase
MIIGNGLLAKAFKKEGSFIDAVIVASGISNSAETRVQEFERERRMLSELFEMHAGKTFVYFSSCALIDDRLLSVAYYRHKLEMEKFFKKNVNHIILRLPQLIGCSPNPYTIINAFRHKIVQGIDVPVQRDAYRYFIDVYDVVSFVMHLNKQSKNNNVTIDFANPFRYSAENILLAVAASMGIYSPKYHLVDGGIAYELDLKFMFSFLENTNIYNFGTQYLHAALTKHNGLTN